VFYNATAFEQGGNNYCCSLAHVSYSHVLRLVITFLRHTRVPAFLLWHDYVMRIPADKGELEDLPQQIALRFGFSFVFDCHSFSI